MHRDLGEEARTTPDRRGSSSSQSEMRAATEGRTRRELQQGDGERVTKLSPSAAVGGVQRLRDELNAALLEQQQRHAMLLQRYTCRRDRDRTAAPVLSHGRNPTAEATDRAVRVAAREPPWPDVDAALRSLKFQSCAAALTQGSRSEGGRSDEERKHTKQRRDRERRYIAWGSGSAEPGLVRQSVRREARYTMAEPAARIAISSKYLLLWRDLARATVIARTFSRRATSHHRVSMLCHAFHAWQLMCRQQQSLRASFRGVVSLSNMSLVAEAYQQWMHAFRRRKGYRVLQASTRRRLLGIVVLFWKAHIRLHHCVNRLRGRSQLRTQQGCWQQWQQYICTRQQQVDQHAVARLHFLRRSWNALVVRVQYRIERRCIVDRQLKQHGKRMLEVYFDGWLEFLEWRRRCQFGTEWHHQRLLETVLSDWKAAKDRAQYTMKLEKRARKKMRRYRVRRCLKMWLRTARYLHYRAYRLKQISNRLVVRRAFAVLYRFNMSLSEGERKLHLWRFRRALRTWLQRTDDRKRRVQRGVEVARKRAAFVKRAYGWTPWRLAYQRSAGTRALAERRCLRGVRRAWDALRAVSAERSRLRSLSALTSDRISSRRLKLAVSAWADSTYDSQVQRQLTHESSVFRSMILKRRSLDDWGRWLTSKRRKRVTDAAADGLILKRAAKRWRSRADQFRCERLTKLAEAERMGWRLLARRCISVWSAYTRQHQLRLRRQMFASWRHCVRLQKAEQALITVARPLKLHHYWHQWLRLVRYNTELHERSRQVSLKRKRRLKYVLFVQKWLIKARHYRDARQLIRVIARKTSWRWFFSRWKLWSMDRVRKQRAIEFSERSLERQFLWGLYAGTVGQMKRANGHHRHRQLKQAWGAWKARRDASQLVVAAENHFHQFRLARALSYLQASASRAQLERAHRQRAELWRRDVILQTGFGHWYFATQRLVRLRKVQEELHWHHVGAKPFRRWRFAHAMQHKFKKASRFHRRMWLKRVFELWLQITKRRLVAVAMWRYAMDRIRSARAVASWAMHTAARRRVALGVEMLCRRRHGRILQRCFLQWEQMLVVEISRSICLRRRTIRWAGRCLQHWKRFLAIERMHRDHCFKTLRSSYIRLRRFATRQQAKRFLRQQSVRAALHRALHSWQIEFHMARALHKASRALLLRCVGDWVRYVAGCRQQRQWIRYIQRLHEIHETRSEANAIGELWQAPSQGDRRRSAGYAHIYQAEQRELQTQVLHAWYLATKSSQRRISAATGCKTRRCEISARGQRKVRTTSNRVLALRFWSTHLVSRVFGAWRSLGRWKEPLQQIGKQQTASFSFATNSTH